ncbi:type III-B CRISPR module-associated Cmr3 family protein [Thermogemmatispora carboxidivorans]|uniref:type III-B CRISPR module-associated Cmr3 family protein n=1 Tax=Thermogemmatispora carboxidivorans TaxID=1382306 RepID=UPI0006999372|nr:type III-B CRISPR module-associated Cmr3 family protein [Thermogemmatispora carboxidivorans]
MYLFIEPHETLLFRSGRPFDAGEVGFAESLFPPTPETLQGSLRELIARHWDQRKSLPELLRDPALTALIGNQTGYGRLRIRLIALARRQRAPNGAQRFELLYPMPAHLLRGPGPQGQPTRLLRLKPASPAGVSTNLPQGLQLLYPQGQEQEQPLGKSSRLRGWLTAPGLEAALRPDGQLTDAMFVPASEIYEEEPRTGIARQERTRTTEEGMLYTIYAVRLRPGYGFMVNLRLAQTADPLSDQLLPDEQTASLLRLPLPPAHFAHTLGGESRPVTVWLIDPQATPVRAAAPQTPDHLSGQRLLLYLATPAIFGKGWQPERWPADLGAPIAAAIGGYQWIGGWQMNPSHHGGQSKMARRCVPAGSVYFFDKKTDGDLYQLTDIGKERGYGTILKGAW